MKKIIQTIIIGIIITLFCSCTVRFYYVEIHTDPESTVDFEILVEAEVPHTTTLDTGLEFDPGVI